MRASCRGRRSTVADDVPAEVEKAVDIVSPRLHAEVRRMIWAFIPIQKRFTYGSHMALR